MSRSVLRRGCDDVHNRKIISLTAFDDFKLNDAVTRALIEEKYTTPTPIQAQTIPTVMAGRDVIGPPTVSSSVGSGTPHVAASRAFWYSLLS